MSPQDQDLMEAAREWTLPEGLVLVRPLGQSPLSQVILVSDGKEGGERFALKVLRASAAKDERIRERFRREAKLLADLEHPNLVRSHGDCEVDDRPALLLEYIPGKSLRHRLVDGPLGWEQAARFGVQVARALAHLHRRQAIHRDVKPHNILLHPTRGAVLADLGLVRVEEDPTMTAHGAALGSPAYMSPEQARDPSEVDAQADLYSLGATLFHTVAGKPPFLGGGVGEVIHRLLHEEPEELPPELPTPLVKVLRTAMAKEPDRRYLRARDLGNDLGRVLLGYPPRLMTAYRRRRSQRRGMMVAASSLALLALVWWRPWSTSSAVESGKDFAVASAELTDGTAPDGEADPVAGLPVEETDTKRAEEHFRGWIRLSEERLLQALADGQLIEAEAQLTTVMLLPPPPQAPDGFLQRRRDWEARRRQQLQAAIERTVGRALDLLMDQAVQARQAIERGSFEAESWKAGVERQWHQAGLRVPQLPRRSGHSDPLARLETLTAVLQEEDEQARVAAALQQVDSLRSTTDLLLPSMAFEEALRRWQEVDPRAFLHSAEARAELERVESLVHLQQQFERRLQESLGQQLDLLLRDGAALRGQVVEAPDGGGLVIHYRERSLVRPSLAVLDADFAVEWATSFDDPWLAAHLAWCQGDYGDAWALMQEAQAQEERGGRTVDLWRREWQELPPSSAPIEVLAGAEEEISDTSTRPWAEWTPFERLQRVVQEDHPQASIREVDGLAQVEFEDLLWNGDWLLTLGSESSAWELDSWQLEWELPRGRKPPKSLSLSKTVRLLHVSRRNPVRMEVNGQLYPGFGVQAGLGRQRLLWQDGRLTLDDLPVCDWQPSTAERSRFSADSSKDFRLLRLVITFRRR